jgi:hypothetical protein
VLLDTFSLPVAGFISTSGSTHWSAGFDAMGQFIEDRVLHAREDAEENGRGRASGRPRCVHNRASGLLRERRGYVDGEPGLRRLAGDDVVLEPRAFSESRLF